MKLRREHLLIMPEVELEADPRVANRVNRRQKRFHVVAKGKRSHPTASLGVSETSTSSLPNTRKAPKTLPEKNTVHAFGFQGQETIGWPKTGYARIGTLIGSRLYKPPRISQNELGGSRRRRKHSTQSIGA